MYDLISRQAAIDVIEAGRLTKLIEAEVAVNGLKALPSAQPEQRWIPVTERLPESSSVWRTEYLATVFCAQWKKKTETMCVQWENTTVRGERTSRWILNDRLLPKAWKIIAWMPLPEKYSCVDGICL